MVVGSFRAAGFTPDRFERSRAAHIAMADALTRAEDCLELRRRDRERAAIRKVRRRIESECEGEK